MIKNNNFWATENFFPRNDTKSNSNWNCDAVRPLVWPDVGRKSSPSFSKKWPKRSQVSLIEKVAFSKTPQKFTKHLCYLVIKFVTKNVKKSPNLATLLSNFSAFRSIWRRKFRGIFSVFEQKNLSFVTSFLLFHFFCQLHHFHKCDQITIFLHNLAF